MVPPDWRGVARPIPKTVQMISRRTLMAGAASLAALSVAGCARRQSFPQAAPAAWARPDPASFGLDAVIDMNHSTMVSDFAAIRRQSAIRAVIHKASEGGDWFDPAYAARRRQAEAAGLLWGAYHFGTGQYPGADQARAFVAAAEPGPSTLLVLDLEPNERRPANTMSLNQAEAFVQTVGRLTGRLPLLYTHPLWANGGRYGKARLTLGGAIAPGSILAACDLWVADYRTSPELPWAWADRGWHLWQYAGDDSRGGGGQLGHMSRAVAGVDRCDRNMFRGDLAALYRYWNGGAGAV